MQENITARSITLRNDNGGWLGQVVLTSDGMFAAVTDYGNFSFSWRSIGDRTFEDFIIKLGEDYFAGKMVNSLSYILLNKKIDKAASIFTSKILPALQKFLKEEKAKIAPQDTTEAVENIA
jgi:hypothetical protein